jgi:choline dehydrogenase
LCFFIKKEPFQINKFKTRVNILNFHSINTGNTGILILTHYKHSKLMENFDYIILGAGSAGCVLANRLSKNPDNKVLLIEAGGKDNYPWIHIPVGYFKTMHNPKTDWCYNTEPDETMNNRSIRYPRGKTLGGSSSINGLLYIRGQHRDYDIWRQLGNKGWSWNDVLPYFIKAENQERGENEYHGVGGPLSISNQRMSLPLLNEFRNAAEEFGIPKTEDFNTGNNHGCGYYQVTEKDGFRCSTAVGYLNPIKKRPNLKIIINAHVKKINFENKVAKEVEYWVANQLFTVSANKEIILSSGAIGSPQLLQVSGIGDSNKLKKLGIQIIHELKGVGENLQDHLMFRPIYKIQKLKSLNKKINSLFGNLLIGLEYVFNRSGPMTIGASQLGMFAKSDPSIELPDLQWHVQPMSMDTLGATKNHDFHAFTPTVSNIRPTSKGHISIVDKDSRVYAKVKMNYLSTAVDRKIAAAGLKLTRKIVLESETFKKFSPEEYRPGIHLNEDEDILKAAAEYAQTIFHPVGTCKMGQDDMAVVDDQLKVKGVKNLRVIDASIMPNITSGNTNAPTIMIAEKGADMILSS